MDLRQHRDRGAAAVEYGLLLALLAAVVSTSVAALGNSTQDLYRQACAAVSSVSSCGTGGGAGGGTGPGNGNGPGNSNGPGNGNGVGHGGGNGGTSNGNGNGQTSNGTGNTGHANNGQSGTP